MRTVCPRAIARNPQLTLLLPARHWRTYPKPVQILAKRHGFTLETAATIAELAGIGGGCR